MYVKIRKITTFTTDNDLIINISKTATVNVLREQIQQKWGYEPFKQKLFYKGKQLNEENRLMDYDIQLNDVIQLMIQAKVKTEATTSEEVTKKKKEEFENELIDVESAYYKVGDRIDLHDEEFGGWFEYYIVSIKAKRCLSEKISEQDIRFFAKSEFEREQAPYEVGFDEIRPRSRYTYQFSELKVGETVLVNHNIEEPTERGYWYDFTITKLDKKDVVGTLKLGQNKVPVDNCTIKFVNEIMKIETAQLLSERTEDLSEAVPIRKSQFYCQKCKDNKARKCKDCGCHVCGGKNEPSTIIICDECNMGFHISCINLTKIPDTDEWYCPGCKNDENEIVKAGEKLKLTKRKEKMVSSNKEVTGRDWGKGMACVGRTKECTIVPKDHSGPVPGVEVGTCWKFRLQVSEAGIHRPHVAGIHGRETDGAYSLVLSGGYEDDIDNGNEFYYTGSGGRDLSGNKRVNDQSCDQKLTRMNKALAINCKAKFNSENGADAGEDWKKGKPVRVVRNYKLGKHSKYAPKDGNRYDGIYKVVKYYPEKGKSGYIVWRYLLRRDDEKPAPWEKDGHEFDMIYPPGYLEAQSEKEEEQTKKRKSVLKETNEKETPSKKRKLEFKLDDKVKELIKSDTPNEKLWEECNEVLPSGKLEYLKKVQDLFICICCQEVVYKPITTECKHNVCYSCLKRSFTSLIYTCPYCRFDLGADYKMEVNKNLSEVLLQLLPGYDAGR